MNTGTFTINALFQQLGLESTDDAIRNFLRTRSPLPQQMPLHQAAIWNNSQATFLQEAIQEDSDWCLVVDQLDSLLR